MRGRGSAFLRSAAICALLWLARVPAGTGQALDLGPPRSVAPGVTLFHLTDPNLLDPSAPVSVWLLKLDLASVDLGPALATDEIVDTETVAETAARRQAVAAVNAGFFLLPSGDPSGIYKLNGQLVSDTRRPRGAVGFLRSGGSLRLIYGRVAATMSLRLPRPGRLQRNTIADDINDFAAELFQVARIEIRRAERRLKQGVCLPFGRGRPQIPVAAIVHRQESGIIGVEYGNPHEAKS